LKLKKNDTFVFSLFGQSHFVTHITKALKLTKGKLITHQFPDGESYIRYGDSLKGKKVVIIDTLDHPNEKTLPLIFAAETAKELGATNVGLVAPYLAYMRQDTRFHPGEAITSTYFGKLISQAFDWMVTVDPHLHRRHTLSEIYTIPTQVVSAAPIISSWIEKHVSQAVLIGPDEESKQWVSQIAQGIHIPFTVLEKTRLDDHHVNVSVPALKNFSHHTPVLIDDIVSTGQTMIETIRHLKVIGAKPPVCIVVHPIFAGIRTQTLIEAGAKQVVSCNTIPHNSNELDLSEILAAAINQSFLAIQAE
jgi:ribose-phosphate pyrophosphokinase